MKTIPASLLSAVICIGISIVVLMELGTKWHGNYEYYGQYPALYLIPGVVGFFLPPLFAWCIKKIRTGKGDDA